MIRAARADSRVARGWRDLPLHTRILLGLATGAGAGVASKLLFGDAPALRELVRLVTEPLGRMWLAALIMVVIPLILSTISLGVIGLGSLAHVGRVGLRTLLCFVSLTAASTALGLVLMNGLGPGRRLDPEVKAQLLETYKGNADGAMGLSVANFGIDLLVKIVPRNPLQAAANGDMLAVIFFALMLGVSLASLDADRAAPLVRLLESVGHVTVVMIDLVMRLGPYGVFCLIFSVTARFGFDLLVSLLFYVATVAGGLLLFQIVGYSLILRLVAKRAPGEFFRRARLVMLTAFSTSSSNATLPTTLRVAEQDLGVPPRIGGFVLPLGATMNMNGTALFEGATVLFLAQVFGVELSIGQQLVVVLMSVVTAIGAAGIPGGSIPLLMMVLGMVGVPIEGIAIVLGVDRILDMCRTVLNVTGDLVTAIVVTRFE